MLSVDEHLLDADGDLGTVDLVVAEDADHALARLHLAALLRQVLCTIEDLHVAPVGEVRD